MRQIFDGSLEVADRIWFNDETRLRFRIGGFNQAQRERLKDFAFIEVVLKETAEGKMEAEIFITTKQDEKKGMEIMREHANQKKKKRK